jgi:hypothetical protein
VRHTHVITSVPLGAGVEHGGSSVASLSGRLPRQRRRSRAGMLETSGWPHICPQASP